MVVFVNLARPELRAIAPPGLDLILDVLRGNNLSVLIHGNGVVGIVLLRLLYSYSLHRNHERVTCATLPFGVGGLERFIRYEHRILLHLHHRP